MLNNDLCPLGFQTIGDPDVPWHNPAACSQLHVTKGTYRTECQDATTEGVDVGNMSAKDTNIIRSSIRCIVSDTLVILEVSDRNIY